MSQPNSTTRVCPSCGASTRLHSARLNTWACTCREIPFVEGNVVKKTFLTKLEQNIGKLQPGTTGVWQNQAFTLTGVIRIWFEEAVLNYWTVVMQDDTIWYLEEGYGFYAFLKPDQTVTPFTESHLKKLRSDNKPKLKGNQPYLFINKNDFWKVEVEGAIHLPAIPKETKLYDFAADNGSKLSILQWDPETIQTYEAISVKQEDLQFALLREAQVNEGYSFTCSACPEKITIKAFPYSLSCACTRCGTGYQYIPYKGFTKAFTRQKDFTPQFEMGVKGIVDGIEWEVRGCTQKEENNKYRSKWREYTLYNELQGFAFLSEFDGHWTFLREQVKTPVLYLENNSDFTYDREPFTIFNKYQYKVITAAGEFPHNLFNNNDTLAKEYISPPEIWICEKNKQEGIRWFFGRHISKKEIRKAFPLDHALPYRIGTGAVQPTGYKNPVQLAVTSLVAIVLLVLIHSIFATTQEHKLLFEERLSFVDSTNQATYVSPKLELRKGSSNLKLILQAPVNNSWAEVGATLVNSVTGKEYFVSQGIEYYSGYSEGEVWREGSQSSEAFFTAIPSGTYQLQLMATRDPNDLNINEVVVSAEYDVETPRNLVIPIILIIAWSVISYYVSQIFERDRWRNSPFSTYTYSNE